MNTIDLVEKYVKQKMIFKDAHDMGHARRVRDWALHIGKKEGYDRLELVEVTALMHDIGHAETKNVKDHGEVGAIMAKKFIRKYKIFSVKDTQKICDAIKYHNTRYGGEGVLSEILRDADMLDLLGAIGVARGISSMASDSIYELTNVKGETWEMNNDDFNKRFDSGQGIGRYMVDQINFQISCYNNLKTTTANIIARPLVKYMKDYIKQLEREVLIPDKIL